LVAAAFVVDAAVLVAVVDVFIEEAGVVVALVDVAFDSLVVVALGVSTCRGATGASTFEYRDCEDKIKRKARIEMETSAIPILVIYLFYPFFVQN
jgi:hypothetical protein